LAVIYNCIDSGHNLIDVELGVSRVAMYRIGENRCAEKALRWGRFGGGRERFPRWRIALIVPMSPSAQAPAISGLFPAAVRFLGVKE
jgi:hypothetical protein